MILRRLNRPPGPAIEPSPPLGDTPIIEIAHVYSRIHARIRPELQPSPTLGDNPPAGDASFSGICSRVDIYCPALLSSPRRLPRRRPAAVALHVQRFCERCRRAVTAPPPPAASSRRRLPPPLLLSPLLIPPPISCFSPPVGCSVYGLLIVGSIATPLFSLARRPHPRCLVIYEWNEVRPDHTASCWYFLCTIPSISTAVGGRAQNGCRSPSWWSFPSSRWVLAGGDASSRADVFPAARLQRVHALKCVC